MEEWIVVAVELLRRAWQRIGPYVLIELLLPGGTLIALAVFVWRRGKIGWPLSISRPAERL